MYAAPGTEFTSYCTGVYVSKNPLGPYTCMPGAPFAIKAGDLLKELVMDTHLKTVMEMTGMQPQSSLHLKNIMNVALAYFLLFIKMVMLMP